MVWPPRQSFLQWKNIFVTGVASNLRISWYCLPPQSVITTQLYLLMDDSASSCDFYFVLPLLLVNMFILCGLCLSLQ